MSPSQSCDEWWRDPTTYLMIVMAGVIVFCVVMMGVETFRSDDLICNDGEHYQQTGIVIVGKTVIPQYGCVR